MTSSCQTGSNSQCHLIMSVLHAFLDRIVGEHQELLQIPFPGTNNWEETPGQTQNSLERLHTSSGLGTLRDPQEELESVAGQKGIQNTLLKAHLYIRNWYWQSLLILSVFVYVFCFEQSRIFYSFGEQRSIVANSGSKTRPQDERMDGWIIRHKSFPCCLLHNFSHLWANILVCFMWYLTLNPSWHVFSLLSHLPNFIVCVVDIQISLESVKMIVRQSESWFCQQFVGKEGHFQNKPDLRVL